MQHKRNLHIEREMTQTEAIKEQKSGKEESAILYVFSVLTNENKKQLALKLNHVATVNKMDTGNSWRQQT